MSLWQQALLRLDALDRRLHFALRRTLAVVLLMLFLGSLGLMLHGWFRIMQPYAE